MLHLSNCFVHFSAIRTHKQVMQTMLERKFWQLWEADQSICGTRICREMGGASRAQAHTVVHFSDVRLCKKTAVNWLPLMPHNTFHRCSPMKVLSHNQVPSWAHVHKPARSHEKQTCHSVFQACAKCLNVRRSLHKCCSCMTITLNGTGSAQNYVIEIAYICALPRIPIACVLKAAIFNVR